MQRLHDEEVAREPAAASPDPANEGRAVITLAPVVATATRRMGDEMGNVGPTEVVRRGLMLLDLRLSLPRNEELVIRDKATGKCERIHFAWDTF